MQDEHWMINTILGQAATKNCYQHPTVQNQNSRVRL